MFFDDFVVQWTLLVERLIVSELTNFVSATLPLLN